MKRRHFIVRRIGRPRGFTLVELIAASAIAATLLAGLMLFLTVLARDRQAIAAVETSESQELSIVDLLQRDLSNARGYYVDAEGSLVLQGFGAIDSRSLRPFDQAVNVTYKIERDGLHPCLYRVQQSLDEPIPPPPQVQMIAFGVNGLQLKALSQSLIVSTTNPSQNQRSAQTTRAVSLPAVPSHVAITVKFEPGFGQDINQSMWMR